MFDKQRACFFVSLFCGGVYGKYTHTESIECTYSVYDIIRMHIFPKVIIYLFTFVYCHAMNHDANIETIEQWIFKGCGCLLWSLLLFIEMFDGFIMEFLVWQWF